MGRRETPESLETKPQLPLHLRALVRPRSVAVIGASRTPGKVGHSVLSNLLGSGYRGRIYPVNPKEEEILGLRCYPRIEAVGEEVDLAIVAIPAPAVPGVAEECGRTGVKGLIVLSAGFKERGKEGLRLEKQLVEVCRRYKMRLVGPNCLGIMDTHTPLNASFASRMPHQGEIAFISQSGALGTAILDWSLARGIGFSKFISMGNKADLDETDFMELAAADDETKVILSYVENVTDGFHFMDVARLASRRKPIVILKSGVSEAGARAATSHTGALAGNDRVYETVFQQCGIVRARTVQELFDLASVFVTQPRPAGRQVAIVTNAGGPGIIAADRVELLGLAMTRLSRETVEALRQKLPPEASLYNPVDVIGDARADRYAAAVELVLGDPNVHSLVVILTPQDMTEPLPTAEAVLEARRHHPDKPVVAAFIGGEAVAQAAHRLTEGGVPCFAFPEPAVAALASLVDYAERTRKNWNGQRLDLAIDRSPVEQILEEVRRDKRQLLLGSEAARVVEAYGVPIVPSVLVRSPREAARAAQELGFPVVLKLAAPRVQHKTDLGGVRLNLRTAEEVEAQYEEMIHQFQRRSPAGEVYGAEVQPMLPPGRELIVGMVRDHQFGPILMFGLGGIYVNLFRDVAFRAVHGLTRQEIETMIRETKAFLLLRGARGEPPADVPAVVDVLSRVARLVSDFPELMELDINPLFAYEKGVAAVDVKITMA